MPAMSEKESVISDQELLQTFLSGDGYGFERLYERYRAGVYTYLVSLLRSREDAEDLFHELWIRIIERARKASISGNFKAFLFVSARNLALDRRALITRTQQSLAELQLLTIQRTVTDPRSDIELAEVHGALETLPPVQQEAVVLKIWCDLSFSELAEVLGIPEGTAMSRYRTGITKLKEKLQHGFV
jgi:RNA polymerase sigma factor (sigma-70 family)